MYCWICGKKADSREHTIKKSDVIRAHGKGPYQGDNSVAHIKWDGTKTLIQGPDSKRIKYSPSLCQKCNGTYTQPFDRAYDIFIEYIYKNEDLILKKRFINFADVYGTDNFEVGQRNLYKYFAKSFGCRLYDAGVTVPDDIISLLGKEHFETGLLINFSVHEDILRFPNEIRDGFIGKGNLLSNMDERSKPIFKSFSWNEHVSWLTVSYWYLEYPYGGLGSIWIADNQFIYLGSKQVLSKEQIQQLEELQKDYNSAN